MDVLAAHQYGFENVVASMGTALTEQQVAVFLGSAKKLVLALDPDNAGGEATFRGLVDALHALDVESVAKGRRVTIYQRRARDLSVWVAALPPGKDPDEVVREDPNAWKSYITEAVPLLEYFFSSAYRRWDLSTSDGKLQAAQELYPLIAEMQNPFDQERYFRQLAETLGVSPATLEASLGRLQHPRARGSRTQPALVASASPFEKENRFSQEEHLLALVLQWPELREHVRGMDPQSLEHWENREIFTSWIRCSTMDELYQMLDQDLRQRLDYLQSLSIPPTDLHQREQAVKDCLHHLEEHRLRNLKVEEALLLGQDDQPDGIEHQMVDINEQLKQLFIKKSQYRRLR